MDEYDPTIEDSYRKQVVISGLRKSEEEERAQASKKKKSSGISGLWNVFGGKKDKKEEKKEEKKEGPKIKVDAANPNALVCRFSTLEEVIPCMTGDPIYCSQCQAVFSCVSTFLAENWSCEFCGHQNTELQLDEEEIPPKDQAVSEFMLEAAEMKEGKEGVIVYCVDISGSMCVTTEIPAVQSEWKKLRAQKAGGNEKPAADQYLPGERRDIEYISRLDCIKAAVLTQLERIAIENANKKVILITFNNEIQIHLANQANDTVVITGDKLFDLQAIFSTVEQINFESTKKITESQQTLVNLINALEEGGATALGPALAAAVQIASKFENSEIILSTDGMPNVGIGALDDGSEQGRKFYQEIAKIAKGNSTVVNIITIQGCDCSIEDFKMVADVTSGQLNSLHPLELVRQIRKISQNPVIATEVELSVLLHPSLELTLFSEGKRSEIKSDNRVVVPIGNVTKTTDVSFEFNVRKEYKKKLKLTQLPFQFQISYRKKDGSKCLRTVSKYRAISNNRAEVEKNINAAVIGLTTIQHVAQAAENENYEQARLKLHAARKMMERGAVNDEQQEEFGNFVSQTEPLENELMKFTKTKQCKKDDEAVQLFFQMKKTDISKFLSADKKSDIVKQRKGNSELNAKYYAYQF